MIRPRVLSFLMLITCIWFAARHGISQDAREIVKRSYDLMQGRSNYSEMSMTIHRPKWERTISMKSWIKGSDFALIYITEPAKEKGQVFLKRASEMWNWVPSIDRMIKIPPSMMMQSWMGSDLTNNDLVNEASIINDYSHRILGKEVEAGYTCYKIELIPDEDAPVVWGKIISWISEKEYFTLKNEYFDEDDILINTETMSEIKTFGGKVIPTVYQIIPEDKPEHFTRMVIHLVRFDEPIEDSFFSIQNMKSIR